MGQYAAQLERYDQAIEIYEEVTSFLNGVKNRNWLLGLFWTKLAEDVDHNFTILWLTLGHTLQVKPN